MTNVTQSERRSVVLEILGLIESSDANAAACLDWYAVEVAGLAPETVAERRGLQMDSVRMNLSRAKTQTEDRLLTGGAADARDEDGGESSDE